jgi:hypothetical protein
MNDEQSIHQIWSSYGKYEITVGTIVLVKKQQINDITDTRVSTFPITFLNYLVLTTNIMFFFFV